MPRVWQEQGPHRQRLQAHACPPAPLLPHTAGTATWHLSVHACLHTSPPNTPCPHLHTPCPCLHTPASQAFRTRLTLGVSETRMLSYSYFCVIMEAAARRGKVTPHKDHTNHTCMWGHVFSPRGLCCGPHITWEGRRGGDGCGSIPWRGSPAGLLLPGAWLRVSVALAGTWFAK